MATAPKKLPPWLTKGDKKEDKKGPMKPMGKEKMMGKAAKKKC